MTPTWTSRERSASAIVGAFGAAFLALAIVAPPPEYTPLFRLGIAFNGFALALSPHVLFEGVSLDGLKLRGPYLFGASAVLEFLSLWCLIVALLYWLTTEPGK
jgi:hypothetical protein